MSLQEDNTPARSPAADSNSDAAGAVLSDSEAPRDKTGFQSDAVRQRYQNPLMQLEDTDHTPASKHVRKSSAHTAVYNYHVNHNQLFRVLLSAGGRIEDRGSMPSRVRLNRDWFYCIVRNFGE